MTDAQQIFATRVADLGLSCRHVDDFPAETPDTLVLPWLTGASVVDLAGVPDDQRERITRVVCHFHADQSQIEQDARAIAGFTKQLSQSFEEVNLIYRMARLLTSSSEPAEVVDQMCDELRTTLKYDWMAMTFADSDVVLSALRRAVRVAGALPCDRQELINDCGTLGDQRVLVPGRHPLATRARAEVMVEPVTLGKAPVGLLLAGNRLGDDPDVCSNDLQLFGAAANFLGLFHENAKRFADQSAQFLGTLHALSAAVDAKDPYTRGHSDRVALVAWQLAKAVGYDADAAQAVRVAGQLHDIGKIGVPEATLRKPSKLNDEEFAQIKKHPEMGYEILKDIPSLGYHLPGVLHHHERWDGRGYPHKLAGEAIPMVARILAYADTFDAMSSNRAYRKGLERSAILAEVRKSAGTQLDPGLIDAFTSLDFTAFDEMLRAETPQEVAAPVAAPVSAAA